MHYLPLMMHGTTAKESLKSPFYYAFDGRNIAVCFCTERDFAQHQIETSRLQHFTEEQTSRDDCEWGLGVLEFGSIEQVVLFVKRWDVYVETKLGKLQPTALAVWRPDEPHRFILFDEIEKEIERVKNTDEQ